MDTQLSPTPGAKMLYLIKRRATASREELIAHWFANHMPQVIQAQHDQAARGKVHATRYIATLFDADRNGEHPWDGIAQLWFDRQLPRPEVPFGTEPTDTFQQKAEPYVPWATREYVVLDGSDHLVSEPLTLNAPYPSTRSGFFKVSFFVKSRSDSDHGAFFAHWLDVHVPNVRDTLISVNGFGYVVSHSLEPTLEPYAGLAELYFHDEAGWSGYRESIKPDGMEEWVDPDGTLVLRARTEMIGIP
ncbi:MAG: hypothetical protein O7C67_00045 [Gammaproteobacteria bacterium]|nr:hypothetical protein [Gammaproteobacteria bacterium]